MEEQNQVQNCKNLWKIYNESENRIKSEAIVKRAYIEKISKNTIKEKVDSELNAIKSEIKDINPKFKEGVKNYDSVKQIVLETLSNYEQALTELSEFYDVKIEQLILRKVELEASLIGSILNDEYLNQKIVRKNEQKENDKAKKSIKENIKIVIEKIKNRKNNNSEIDSKMIANLLDQQDVAVEIEQQLSDTLEKSLKDKNDNSDQIEKLEKEISMISAEINRINENKQKSIYDAMEVGSKSLAVNIKKPKMFKRITRFFVSRFNTQKVIISTIIEPLNMRINDFRINELSNIKN